MTETEAASVAAAKVAAVSGDAAARFRLATEFYLAGAPRHRAYGRAELAFLRWEIARGVLDPPDAARPGSRWWRAVNDRLLRDKIEAAALEDGHGGQCCGSRGGRTDGSLSEGPLSEGPLSEGPLSEGNGAVSAPSVAMWREFLRAPSPAAWYRAHNSSVVAGYLGHLDLAEAELPAERFMMNVALLRVLYTHALVARPRLALGAFGAVGRVAADPRRGSVGFFLDLRRGFPERYPLTGLAAEDLVGTEGPLPRLLDYGVIAPRLADVYTFAAATLGEPRTLEMLSDGLPCYALPAARPELWRDGRDGRGGQVLNRLTAYATGAGSRRRQAS
ncbi:hypothetical protein [Spirillospora sp. NPDC047279]|uniref:hypothetical protein n=1 Tax=Spirillospora sp. NPDC047279 TaxID=3155478 RepID=UPI0033FC96B7